MIALVNSLVVVVIELSVMPAEKKDTSLETVQVLKMMIKIILRSSGLLSFIITM